MNTRLQQDQNPLLRLTDHAFQLVTFVEFHCPSQCIHIECPQPQKHLLSSSHCALSALSSLFSWSIPYPLEGEKRMAGKKTEWARFLYPNIHGEFSLSIFLVQCIKFPTFHQGSMPISPVPAPLVPLSPHSRVNMAWQTREEKPTYM